MNQNTGPDAPHLKNFTFAPIGRDDFPLLGQWLSMPHVARWWSDDAAPAAIEAGYGGCVDGSEPAEVFIAHCDGIAVGLIQRFRLGAYPGYLDELAQIVAVPHDASSIDYLVGPPDALGKGTGTAMIAAFAGLVWEDDPGTPAIIVPVHAENRNSWRALERAGFVRVAAGELAPDNPENSRAHYIYQLNAAARK